MNTRPLIETSSSPAALSVSFNQDASNFAVGLENGFAVFSSEACQLRSTRDFGGGVGVAEMLGKSNFVGVVGGGKQPKYSQNRVCIWDESKQKPVITIPALMSTVRGLKLSKKFIVVALLNSVKVYHFTQPPETWASFETVNNPYGLCLLNEDVVILPGRTSGQLQVVELKTGNVSIIPAHSGALRAIAVSQDGEVIATASETGTLIRIFAASNCARLCELRRGVDPATVFSLAFSPSGQQLAVTSDKSTLHVFDVPHPSKAPRKATTASQRNASQASLITPASAQGEPTQKWGILSRIPLLPRVFSDIYSFASANFEMGDEGIGNSAGNLTADGVTRTVKGLIGFTAEYTIIVIGAGKDARWEKFIIFETEGGQRYCQKEGWKRFLGVH